MLFILQLQRWHLPLATTGAPLQCFVTPDSISHLHNRPLSVFTSNARLRYCLLDNAASNKKDVCFKANGGVGLQKKQSAAWAYLPSGHLCSTAFRLIIVEVFALFLLATRWQLNSARQSLVFSTKEHFVSLVNIIELAIHRIELTRFPLCPWVCLT